MSIFIIMDYTKDLIRKIKILAAQLEKRQNDLLEEAIQDLLKKYENRAEP